MTVASLTWRTVLGAGPGPGQAPGQAPRLQRISEQLLCHLPVCLIRSWQGKVVGRERVMDMTKMCYIHIWNHPAVRTFADPSKGSRLTWQDSQHRCPADPAHSAPTLTPQSASQASNPCSLLRSKLACSQDALFVLCFVFPWESDVSCSVGFKSNSGQFSLQHLFESCFLFAPAENQSLLCWADRGALLSESSFPLLLVALGGICFPLCLSFLFLHPISHQSSLLSIPLCAWLSYCQKLHFCYFGLSWLYPGGLGFFSAFLDI